MLERLPGVERIGPQRVPAPDQTKGGLVGLLGGLALSVAPGALKAVFRALQTVLSRQPPATKVLIQIKGGQVSFEFDSKRIGLQDLVSAAERLGSYRLPEAASRAAEEQQRAESARKEEEEKRRAEAARQEEEEKRRAEAARQLEAEAPRQAPTEKQRAEAARQAGSILWNPPSQIRVARGERIEVRLGDATVAFEKLREGLRGRGVPSLDHLEIAPLMRVTLTADPDDFSIRPLGTADQLVRPGNVARWEFDVMPLRGGLRRLRLLASMRIKVEAKEEVVDLPSYESEVKVRVAPVRAVGQFCERNWQWIAGTIAIPLIVWAATGTGVGSAVLKDLSHWLGVPALR